MNETKSKYSMLLSAYRKEQQQFSAMLKASESKRSETEKILEKQQTLFRSALHEAECTTEAEKERNELNLASHQRQHESLTAQMSFLEKQNEKLQLNLENQEERERKLTEEYVVLHREVENAEASHNALDMTPPFMITVKNRRRCRKKFITGTVVTSRLITN